MQGRKNHSENREGGASKDARATAFDSVRQDTPGDPPECPQDTAMGAGRRSAISDSRPTWSAPPPLAEKALAARDSLEGQRRQVTVLFTDMVGFTPLAERLGEEGIYLLMQPVFKEMIGPYTRTRARCRS